LPLKVQEDMKKIILATLFSVNFAFGQAIKLEPGANGFVSFPVVSTLGACSTTDKGKVVFLTADNKFYFCNGTAWSPNSFSLPFDQSISHITYYDGGTFKITNTYPSSESVAIHGSITGNDGYAIRASSTNTSGFNTGAIYATNSSTNSNGFGVSGNHSGGGVGVSGDSQSGKGISGASSTGIGGYFSSTNGYALVTDVGKVGIGVSPNLNTGEIIDINGRARIRHNIPSNITSGIWMNNSTNSINGNDGAFYGMKQNTQAGIFIGGAWRFWVDNNGVASANGGISVGGGETISKIIKITVLKDVASVGATSYLNVTYSLTGASPGNTVIVTPAFTLSHEGVGSTYLIIAHSLISSSDQVTVCFYNPTANEINPVTMNYYFTIFK
jgi:hypothetical protein